MVPIELLAPETSAAVVVADMGSAATADEVAAVVAVVSGAAELLVVVTEPVAAGEGVLPASPLPVLNVEAGAEETGNGVGPDTGLGDDAGALDGLGGIANPGRGGALPAGTAAPGD